MAHYIVEKEHTYLGDTQYFAENPKKILTINWVGELAKWIFLYRKVGKFFRFDTDTYSKVYIITDNNGSKEFKDVEEHIIRFQKVKS